MRDNRSKFGIGFTTIIMMLVIVVFTTLGVLAISTSKADYSLTKKNEEFVEGYYEARGKAIQIRADINDKLSKGEDILALSESDNLSINGNTIEYAVNVNDKQIISVKLEIQGKSVVTNEFRLENISEWNPIKPIKVWSGK